MSTPKYEERGCPFDEPLPPPRPPTIAELGEDFVAENDKPLPKPPFDWLRLECFCVEVGAWLLLAGFVAFGVYCCHQLK